MSEIRTRYARQVMMPEMGEERQYRLQRSRVLVIGAGGLGSPLLFYLAAAGVGHIAIADFDAVEESNLNRQILHGIADIGALKVVSAQKSLSAINPDIVIESHCVRVTPENMPTLASGIDLVLDAVDSFGAKFTINDACVAMKKPFIHAGATGLNGQIYLYRPGNACLRCFFPPLPRELEAPQGLGILGATAGCIGTQQALLAIRFLAGMYNDADCGSLIAFDGMTLRQRVMPMERSENCSTCGG